MGAGPGGTAVKLTHSTSAAWGSSVQILGTDLCATCQAMLCRHPTYKGEQDGHRCELRANLPQNDNNNNQETN